MNNLMIDIETLGKTVGSVVTQIGAVYFDPISGEIGTEFKMNIDLEDSLALGYDIDAKTLKWWFGQPNEARMSFLMNPIPTTVDSVLKQLHSFARHATQYWSHATFDMPMLEYLYASEGIQSPFRYTRTRDIRTAIELSGIDRNKLFGMFKREGNHHTAVDDCKYQVKYLVHCLNKIKSK